MPYLTNSDNYDAIVVHVNAHQTWGEWGGYVCWGENIKTPHDAIAILALLKLKELGHLPETIAVDEEGEFSSSDDRPWSEWAIVSLQELQGLKELPDAIFLEQDGSEKGLTINDVLDDEWFK